METFLDKLPKPTVKAKLKGFDDYLPIRDEIFTKIDKLESGEITGVSTGFDVLDKATGGMNKGQIWVVGAYSGIGKSYFVVNMVDNIFNQGKKVNTIIFSTELSASEYYWRHALMQYELYENEFQTKIISESDRQAFRTHISNYLEERSDYPDTLKVYGNVSDVAEIENAVKGLKQKDGEYTICFIDFIQELSAGKLRAEKDAMPVIAKRLKELAQKTGMIFVIVSQVNNYMAKEDASSEMMSPFSFGKELNQSAHVSIWLKRKKKNDKFSRCLKAHIIKSRGGTHGKANLMIMAGYRLCEINKAKADELDREIED